MARTKEVLRNKWIKIRVSEKFYDFITEFSDRMGVSMSELCRGALEIFFMSVYLGKVKDIEKNFYGRYKKYFRSILSSTAT